MARSAGVFLPVLLCGCGLDDWSDGSQSIDAVRAEIVARNFGRAVELAADVVEAHPNDPSAFYEQARAEALAGNEGRAFDELEKAIELGLPNAATALNDAAFAGLRRSDRFAALHGKAPPSPNKSSGGPVDALVEAGPDGDVTILELPNGETHIQAGDVSLSTDF
ncbi:hypothetical protein P8R33_12710 [Qipengyuania sp. XHP0211]|uniref:TPR end-of-group domain-containing protein n=1 Tax=Qipengyuania sp. XHP0211 TaxID=3038079 RepID=UPI00241D2DEE|nr:hypothetical protein [Qipengyuania sp. XHP0211]MDG5751971.1 hypothetical protein [Qipengyuania sp. XHP0211]